MPRSSQAPAPDQARAAAKGARTKPGDERRRDLLDAGVAVFADKGVVEATLDDITRQAGVAKGTFYLYFSSKEHLLAALQRRFETELVSRIDDAVARCRRGWPAKLDTWVVACFADYPSDYALHDVLFHHPVVPDHRSVPPSDGERDLPTSLRQVIAGGVAAGDFQVADPELTAILLCSATHRAFDRIWHAGEALETRRLVAASQEMFRRTVGAPAKPARGRAHASERRV